MRRTASTRQVDVFANSIREGIEQLFPTSKVNVKVDGSSLSKGNILISFALWTKYPNDIIHNDPSLTKIWINKSHFDDGSLREDMELEMSLGNRLHGYNAETLEKRIGFRSVKSGDSKKISRAILNYFKKLKIATDKHKDALQESWDLYVSRGNIKVASRRTASEVLRSLEGRIARLEKQSSKLKDVDFKEGTYVSNVHNGKLQLTYFKDGEGFIGVKVELDRYRKHYLITLDDGDQYLVPIDSVNLK